MSTVLICKWFENSLSRWSGSQLTQPGLPAIFSSGYLFFYKYGGDLDSTGMEKPGLRAEVPDNLVNPRELNLTDNDNGYALAA